MKVLGNRLLVKRVDYQKQNKSGIIIPSQVQSDTFIGEVIKTGPGIMNDAGERLEMSVHTGDHIMYTSTSGFHVEIKGTGEFTILNERDVLATLETGEFEEFDA